MTMRKHPNPSSSQSAKLVIEPGKWTVRWAALTSGPGGRFSPSASLEWASSPGAFSGERPRSTTRWRKTSTNIYQDCCPTKNRRMQASKTSLHSGLEVTFAVWNVYLLFNNAFGSKMFTPRPSTFCALKSGCVELDHLQMDLY